MAREGRGVFVPQFLNRLVRTGSKALDWPVLMGVQLPWRVAVDLTVNGKVPENNDRFLGE